MELLLQSIEYYNLFYTVLLGIVMLYWVTVFVGLLDLDAFDIDFDNDIDFEVAKEVDIDLDAEAESNFGSGFGKALHFFNFGRVPFMLNLSVLALLLWTFSTLIHHLIGDGWHTLLMLLFILPNLILGLMITKILTSPFINLLKTMEGSEEVSVIGLVGTLKIGVKKGSSGQCEVYESGKILLLPVITDNEEGFRPGEKVLIVDYKDSQEKYLVEKYDA